MSTLVFCFYCSGDRRDLHSFPTRRSSDLLKTQPIWCGSACKLGTPPWAFLLNRTLGWMPGYRDRKSTRLNSSHSSISYAVFCLKKKTKHNHSNLEAHALLPLAYAAHDHQG